MMWMMVVTRYNAIETGMGLQFRGDGCIVIDVDGQKRFPDFSKTHSLLDLRGRWYNFK